MKKFLTVLLVIAVMFTFSFGSAFAAAPDLSSSITKSEALSYAKTAYDKVLASLRDDVETAIEDLDGGSATNLDALDGGYTTVAGNYVSKAAFEKAIEKDTVYKANKAIVDAVYGKVVDKINEVANADDFGGFIVGDSTAAGTGDAVVNGKKYYGFDLKGTVYTTGAQKLYQMTYEAVKDYAVTAFDTDYVDTTNFDKLAYQEEFAVKKDAALAGIAAINLDAYSKEYKNTEKSNYDKASDDVALATTTIGKIKITAGVAGTDEADVKKAIDAVADVYTPAAGKAKAAGSLYTGEATTKLDEISLENVTDFTGLNNITKDADQAVADDDLAYAKKIVLNKLLGALTEAEEKVLAYQGAIIRVERDEETPDADVIAAANTEIAKTEAAYEDAVAAVKYIVDYVDDVAVLGAFTDGAFAIHQESSTDVWSISDYSGVQKYDDFKALVIYTGAFAAPENGVFQGHATPGPAVNPPLTVEITEVIADIVAAVNKAAENDKLFVNLDGSYAVQIEDALEDAIEDAYIEALNTYRTPTNTSELLERKLELINVGKVTIDGKVYADTVMDWYAEANSDSINDTYEKELNDEIRAIVDETKAAIKAAATIAEADAAFLAGYAKYDALVTANAHNNMFALKSGALYDKYNKYVAQFTNYATAAWSTIGDLDKENDYSVSNLGALVQYYVGASMTDGAFYKGIYDEAALDAVYAEALAAVDGLKTKAQIKEMADAAVTAINAISDTVTIADKAAVAAAYDAYYAYADYVDMIGVDDVFEVDGTYVKALDKLTLADKAVKKAEKKAIKAVTDLFPSTPAKVTLADADNVAKVRELVNAYVNDYVGKDAANSVDTVKKSYATLRTEALNLTGLSYEQFTAYERAVALEQIEDVEEMIAKLAVDPVDEDAVKAARAAYDAIPENIFFKYGYDISKASYDKLVALEKLVGEFDDVDAKAYLQDLSVKARSVKTKAGNVKVTVKADVDVLLENGYTVEYKFYRSTKSNKGFGTAKKVSEETTYTNTSGVKGTKYYYKVVVVAKNAEGEVVAKTPLKHCLYATRTWTK